MEELRHYRALGLPAGADIKQIKSAYRVLAKKYHPDMSKDPATGEQFRRVVAAYKTLVAREEKSVYIRSTVRRTYRSAPTTSQRQSGAKNTREKPSENADNAANNSGNSLYSIGQLLLNGKTASMRAFAAKRLGFSGQKGAYVYLKRALEDPSEAVVLAAVEAIGRLRITISARELEATFESGSRAVKMAVLQAVELSVRKAVFMGILLKGMQSLDRNVRGKALSLFAQAGKEHS